MDVRDEIEKEAGDHEEKYRTKEEEGQKQRLRFVTKCWMIRHQGTRDEKHKDYKIGESVGIRFQRWLVDEK
ncbi:hypothetical protein Tco_1416949, partial [Tanacetum coccineum]